MTTISGFTMCRNADKLYYPICESIKSALPIVDEFIVAIGSGDTDDKTEELIREIASPKIKIIKTEWNLQRFPKGTIHANQTDVAKSHCTGDWLLYLQADEVLHEDDLHVVKTACDTYENDKRVEGLVFNYLHFWGDYKHLIDGHSWYDKEIRVIRNLPEIHSWQSAQSFRWIPKFDGKSYRQKPDTRKLNVKLIEATVYHYGWVRPPEVMTSKMNALDRIHSHPETRYQEAFNYGDMSAKKEFEGNHPDVMHERISKLYWEETLYDKGRTRKFSAKMKHDRFRYRLLTFIEKNLLGGLKIGAYRNFNVLK